jgi:hypothetical protein
MSKKNQIVNNAYRCKKQQKSLAVLSLRHYVENYKEELQTLVLNEINAIDNNDEE